MTEAIAALIGGCLLGLAYAVSGYMMSKRALGSHKRFMFWVVGGTMVRMMVALGAVATVIVILPVHRTVFLGTFFLIFFVALAVEITMLHRRKA